MVLARQMWQDGFLHVCLLHAIQSHMRYSSTYNVVCLSPGQYYKHPQGCSRHGIPVMRLPEPCHVVDLRYFLLSLSIIRTATPTIPRVIQACHIYHKTARSIQSGKLLLMSLSCRGGLMYLSILGKPTDIDVETYSAVHLT